MLVAIDSSAARSAIDVASLAQGKRREDREAQHAIDSKRPAPFVASSHHVAGRVRRAQLATKPGAAFPLADRRVLVTGGSSGIGSVLARALAEEGASVVITGRNEGRLGEVAAAHGGIEAMVCDVTDADQIASVRERVVDRGGIDMLVNCAGVMHFFDVTTGYPLERQLQEIDIDVPGPVRMVAEFLPHLLERRSAIVNVSSVLAFVPYAAAPVYSGVKAFVHAWTISLREQLKGTSVRVVELLPPVTDPPLAEGLNPSFKRMPPEELGDAFLEGLQQGRDEIAPVASVQLKWLSRVAPGFIFGQFNREAPRAR